MERPVRIWRKSLGLTQREAACRVGLSRRSYIDVEVKGVVPRREVVDAFYAESGGVIDANALYGHGTFTAPHAPAQEGVGA